MTHDDSTKTGVPAFRQVGLGQQSLHRCDYCDQPSHSLGSKRIGPMKRFRCARCVQVFADRKEATA